MGKAKLEPPKGISAAIWAEFLASRSHADELTTARNQAAQLLLGRPLPADLCAIGWVDPAPGSIFPAPVAELLAADNAFEALLAGCGLDNVEPIAHFLAGCHFWRDEDDSGDVLFVALPKPTQIDAPCQVVTWFHEEGTFGDSLGDLPSHALGRAGARRNSKTSHWGDRQHRGRWLAQALSGQLPWPGVWPTANDDAGLAAALKAKTFPQDVPEALYWLWRTVLLGQDARARRVIDRLDGSPSRLLRDAARSASEVLDGRVSLGPIADIPALRELLAEIVADPEAAEARMAALAEAEARARVLASLPEGVSLVASKATGDVIWQGTDGNYQAEWTLPDGSRVSVVGAALSVKEPGKRSRAIPGEHVDYGVDAVALRADGKALMVRSQTSLFELELPRGPGRYVCAGSDGSGAIGWIDGDRVLVCSGWDTWTHKLLERRDGYFVPGSSCDVPGGGVLGIVADTRVALCSDGDQLLIVGIYDDRLRELGRVPLDSVDRIGTLGPRVFVHGFDQTVHELTGLAELHAARHPGPWTAPVLNSATPTSPRHAAMLATELSTRMASKAKLAAKHPHEAERVHVRLSPSGRRALVWKSLESDVVVLDVSSGKLLARWQDDPASGHVADATWLDDDHVAWAHWQAHLSRVGEDDPLLDFDHGFTSIAAARGADSRWLIAGVIPADADGPQRLCGIVLARLDADAPWFERPREAIVDRLAWVERIDDEVQLHIGDRAWRVEPPSNADVAPPPEAEYT